MKSLALLILLVLAACGVKTNSIHYGKTTVASLVEDKGQPLKEETVPVSDGKILLYPGDEKYQARGDVIVAGIKTPIGEERTLLYWKHRFKECATEVKKLSPTEFEFACAEEGMSVVYVDGSDYIARIVEYEK